MGLWKRFMFAPTPGANHGIPKSEISDCLEEQTASEQEKRAALEVSAGFADDFEDAIALPSFRR